MRLVPLVALCVALTGCGLAAFPCRAGSAMPEFYEIAAAGGGEAFLSADQRQIMTQLIVLVFGSKHRQKVVEAFKLLGE